MRVHNQISVTTTEKASDRLGKKYVLCKTGTTAVLVAFSFRLAQRPETDWFEIPASKTYKFTAPKGKKIWFLFCKTASGTSTLDITFSEMDIDKVEEVVA